MSRIGKQPIEIPDGVKVSVQDSTVSTEGPQGKLSWTHHPLVSVNVDDAGKVITVTRTGEDRESRSLHGLTRSIVSNMVIGVKEGYARGLEVYGVGYGVELQGQTLKVNCGRSHPVVFTVPAGVTVEVTTPQARGDNEPARLTVKGADKQAVGQFAAQVRQARTPEPYKGKGVRYAGERIIRKAGKQFAGAGSK